MGKGFPIFLSIHPLFRFNFSLLISIRNIVLPDEIQKQGLQEESEPDQNSIVLSDDKGSHPILDND